MYSVTSCPCLPPAYRSWDLFSIVTEPDIQPKVGGICYNQLQNRRPNMLKEEVPYGKKDMVDSDIKSDTMQ